MAIRNLILMTICVFCMMGINETFARDEAVAEQQPAPSMKESFQTAWEENMKALPTTVTFEKTDQPGIYQFETNLFPYKGRLQLNNIVVSRKLNYYYDYDLGVDYAIKGVAEVELLDIPEDDLFKKYRHSYPLWEQGLFLFYDDSSQIWLSAQQWRSRSAIPDENDMAYGASGCKTNCAINNILRKNWPFLVFLLFFVILLIRGKKTQKEQINKFDLSLERQRESLELQKVAVEEIKKQTDIMKQALGK